MALLTAGDKTSIVLIGMRGAGKTTYGKLAAKELGYVFVDLDVVMEDEQGCSCADVVKEHGWDGFRNIETQILKKQVEKHPELAVIACGGGVVENEEARKFLQLQPCVVSVNCPIDDIIAYLSKSATSTESKEEGLERRPNYGEEIQDVWNRRKPWFAECSNRDFYWKPGDDIEEAGKRFFYTLKNVVTPNVVMPNAAFIRHQGATSQSFQGNDAIYVTSKLSTREEAMTLFGQIRSLSHLPIVVNAAENVPLVQFALRANVEIIEFDISIRNKLEEIKTKVRGFGTTKFIVKMGFSESVTGNAVLEKLLNLPDLPVEVIGLKLALEEISISEVNSVFHAIHESKVQERFTGIIVESSSGSGSKLCNTLGVLTGPSCLIELTKSETHETYERLGIERKDLYCLFGKPIQLSPSPTMHNTGFKELGLNRFYSICESSSPLKMESVLRSHRFKGASVTIPHKENVLPLMDTLTDAATKIGAVNTVVRQTDGSYLGDNTDWIGIRNLLQSALPKKEGLKGLVVGAGGTAFAASYCIKFLGIDLFIYNRTLEKAKKVADRFGGTAVEDLKSLDHVDVVVGTVPASAGFQLPDTLVSKCKPIVLDAAYRPRNTKLILQASAAGCTTFVGVQMLVEQGLAQLERWTGQTPPREVIEKNVYDYYEKSGPSASK